MSDQVEANRGENGISAVGCSQFFSSQEATPGAPSIMWKVYA
jgi:hypothetical protein